MATPGSVITGDIGPLPSAQVRELNSMLGQLSNGQMQWVSGYIAGLAAQQGAAPASLPALASAAVAASPSPSLAPVSASVPTPAFTVLYGSQTGNGEQVANALHARLGELGVSATLASMAEYRPRQLRQERHLLLVVSTHGEGDAPDDAQELHEFLGSARAPDLSALSYAVLALGDSSYENFCQTGQEFDARLAALGASRLLDRVDCDVDYEDPAERWISALAEKAQALRPDPAMATAEPVIAGATAVPLQVVPRATPAFDRKHPFAAELLEQRRITDQRSSWDVRHLVFSLESSGLHYEPGDALAVTPVNAPNLVAAIADVLSLDLQATVRDGQGESQSLAHTLSHDYELTQLSRSFLTRWAAHSDASKLQALLAPEHSAELAAYLRSHQLIDVLHEVPAEIEAQDLLTMLRGLTARQYSIASSELATPDEVHVTVANVAYEAFGFEHQGVASGFLSDRVEQGATAPVYIQANRRFRLPQDPDRPIIMIGPGTGVAPFRAFAEHREAQGAGGRSWLFFGARHFATDFLYQTEWLARLRRGALSRMDVAFSRDQSSKIYVQQRMAEQSRDLYAWLQEGAHVYVCGDASRMAADVHQQLLEVVASEGAMDANAADEYLQQCKRDGRYQRDVY